MDIYRLLDMQQTDLGDRPAYSNTPINDRAVIRSPNFAAIQGYMTGEDQTFVNEVREWYFWLWMYAAAGHNYNGGYRLQFRNIQMSARNSTTGNWTNLGPHPFQLSAVQEWNGDSQVGSFGSSSRIRSDGGVAISFASSSVTEGVEVWHSTTAFQDRALFTETDAFVAFCEARVVDNASNPYYGADAQFSAQLGHDQYGIRAATTQKLPNGKPRWRMDGGNGSWVNITGGDWQTVGMATVESDKIGEDPFNGYSTTPAYLYDKEPYVLTRSQLLANYPNILTDSTLVTAPDPEPEPEAETSQGKFDASRVLRAKLQPAASDPAQGAPIAVAELTGGTLEVIKGGQVLGTAPLSPSVTPSYEMAIAESVLTASEGISKDDPDLTARMRSVDGTSFLAGPVDGVTFTLSHSLAAGETAAVKIENISFGEVLVQPTGNTGGGTVNGVYVPPDAILNATETPGPGFPSNVELVIAKNAAIKVSDTFIYLHSDHVATGQSPTSGGSAVGHSGYRAHDSAIRSLYDIKTNAEWWWEGDGLYNTTDLDHYFNGLTKPCLFGIYGQSDWNNANVNRPSRYGSNSRLAGLAEPAIDPTKYADAAAFLANRYGSKIAGFETGNEAKFGYNGNANPAVDTWISNGQSGGFWHGTANQLADAKYYIKQGAGSIPVYGPGWEGGASPTSEEKGSLNWNGDRSILPDAKWNSLVLYYDYATSNGLRAAQFTDIFASHAYYYELDSGISGMRDKAHEARRYAKVSQRVMPDKPKACTEFGFELPGSDIISSPERAKALKRCARIYAAYGFDKFMIYKWSNQRTLGDPYNNPEMRAAVQNCHDLSGTEIEHMALLTTGEVWTCYTNGQTETI